MSSGPQFCSTTRGGTRLCGYMCSGKLVSALGGPLVQGLKEPRRYAQKAAGSQCPSDETTCGLEDWLPDDKFGVKSNIGLDH